ncbi:haloacid dehalogenase [Thioclava dalianensis]|uniref:phosphoglycolate phosphatase n=1 Tax=Thioclava dalianensis TaxID=1185766 RepID=A0A074TH78_9RHOB|nr:HAD family hydrolase [Thioclava dalianensis]KEP71061.1 haloacid dehalogenase [Thioclava dalianensis]SFN25757.1 phosphoglycolate phosphatase [Thioclava dalianensis]
MRTVVFDLDGTLADTSGDLIAAANACFVARGHAPLLDAQDDALIAFQGGRAMLRVGYARVGLEGAALEALVEADYKPLLGYYGAEIDRYTRLYPGAVDAVKTLRNQGFATSICTNKPEGLARDLVARLGVAELFDALIGADTLPVRKPAPEPYIAAVEQAGGTVARSLLLGDTVTDRETARVVGVPSVLVSFGPEGRGIERLAPEALLDRYEDLPALALRLLGAAD